MEILQNLWNTILDITKQFVIPDWGALIALLPAFMGVVVILFLLWAVAKYRGINPRRRRPGRVAPATPPGIHMPGPTYAPFFGAGGTFLLFLGLVFPGPLLALGVIGMVLALLFWGREGLREYHPAALGDRRSGGWLAGAVGRQSGRLGGTWWRAPHHGPECRLRRQDPHGAGRQAVHDRVRQQGRRNAPRRRHPRRERREGVRWEGLPRGRPEDVRRPGPEGRHLQVRVLDPSGPDERATDRRRLSPGGRP